MTFAIRELDRTRDRRAVEAIDTSFETTTVFDVVTTPRSVSLVERPLDQPLIKRYSIGEVFAEWARWDTGWVAEDDGVRGFATVEYEAWHARLVLWFLYISPAWRRRGVGRALLERVEAHGRALGANHVWLETSNVNVPGVAAYERLGYTLCGADRLFYGPYMPGETAIYLAKSLCAADQGAQLAARSDMTEPKPPQTPHPTPHKPEVDDDNPVRKELAKGDVRPDGPGDDSAPVVPERTSNG
ncbi:MAG: GNAT family N-acetyltransferase [Kofleriaceae bacterium]